MMATLDTDLWRTFGLPVELAPVDGGGAELAPRQRFAGVRSGSRVTGEWTLPADADSLHAQSVGVAVEVGGPLMYGVAGPYLLTPGDSIRVSIPAG
jgi:hypothetical protein